MVEPVLPEPGPTPVLVGGGVGALVGAEVAPWTTVVGAGVGEGVGVAVGAAAATPRLALAVLPV
jgi:hypothetical protein